MPANQHYLDQLLSSTMTVTFPYSITMSENDFKLGIAQALKEQVAPAFGLRQGFLHNPTNLPIRLFDFPGVSGDFTPTR